MSAAVTIPRTATEVRALIADSLVRTKPETDAFHQAWYGSRHTWSSTFWMGVPTLKNPLDLWLYQEIIVGYRPALIIETGTAFGGSALFCAHVMDLSYRGALSGHVLTIDNAPQSPLPTHPRLTSLTGDALADETLETVRSYVNGVPAGRNVLVLLDSDHAEAHVRKELDAYAGFVTPGSYLVVEDTNVNGHPVSPDHGPGPYEAVEDFLAAHPEFSRDPYCEKYILTMNPNGWLRRVA